MLQEDRQLDTRLLAHNKNLSFSMFPSPEKLDWKYCFMSLILLATHVDLLNHIIYNSSCTEKKG